MKKARNRKQQQSRKFSNDIQPRAGFVYPKVGDILQVLIAYPTVVNARTVTIPAGTEGTVWDVQKHGALEGGLRSDVGCTLYFWDIFKYHHCGVLIPWDVVSDPARFQFTTAKADGPKDVGMEGKDKPAVATEVKPEKNWVTAQRAQEFNLPPQGPDESESAFKDRISGALRDMGHIIEAHEAATGKLYNDGGDDPLSNPMTGIMGALAQKMQGVDYHQSGSNQVGLDVAAGYVKKDPPREPFGGLTPELAILACALFGGR